jgi:hypothetical protein
VDFANLGAELRLDCVGEVADDLVSLSGLLVQLTLAGCGYKFCFESNNNRMTTPSGSVLKMQKVEDIYIVRMCPPGQKPLMFAAAHCAGQSASNAGANAR